MIYCSQKGFHEYRKIWSQKLSKILIVKREKINVFDLYAMGLYCGIKGKIEDLTLIGYHPRETYCFCKFYFEYNGELDGIDRPTKFLRFLFPQGALKILINLYVKK